MDTKLKKYRYSVLLKTLAVILCVAGMLTAAYGLEKAPYFDMGIQNKDFKKSLYLRDILKETYNQAFDISMNYINEENIKSGACLDKNAVNDRKNRLQSEKQTEVTLINDYYNSLMANYTNVKTDINDALNSQSEKNPELQKLLDERKSEIEKIENKYKTKIYYIEADYIKEQLAQYHAKMDTLIKTKGIYYSVVKNGNVTLTNNYNNNPENFFKSLPVSFQLKQGSNNENDNLFYTASIPSDTIIFLGLSQERYNAELLTYNENVKEGLSGIKLVVIGLAVFLLALCYIIYTAGRSRRKDGLLLLPIDDIYLDVALAVLAGIIILCISSVYEYGRYIIFPTSFYYNVSIITVLLGVAISVGTLAGIVLVTMFVRRFKRHEVIKSTLMYKAFIWIKNNLFKKIVKNLLSVYDNSPAALRLILIFGIYALATLVSVALLFTESVGTLFGLTLLVGINVTAVYFVLDAFKSLKDITAGAKRIRSGEQSTYIPPQKIPELKELSETIDSIADGLKHAVNNQVKAEKMKAELITNVSHDLKTPLTSIITYVDLLKSEGLSSENSQKYIDIIDKKSQRLKTLTEDLFEAAKASSGSITVNAEEINIVSLINQGLGELSDKIQSSGLNFKTNFSSDKLLVTADGKLLWRVIENLLSNVFKYAMPNSRVYIETTDINDNIVVSVKNISAYELNIPADELLERFKRGDSSRNSEGSGLGLSIARSLTEIQGGSFSISIDGDLFKATIVIPKAK
ncbi:integral membrane sensor signal transduction histidine kinase [Ruminiclostridium papyrosolvens DSM 2782]|uniref:histidine kinase n=1 Tax=Ruminiclostridium papyrosolvens DSM 2782 TaxID=588581 RepID=F1TAI4_9FIRM|nr:HAMP domain-containing sensor histidine kinase [Ruminiclostridium papyrosolvens]EGD48527.1 integral membrane sensor signal transduction histidine kinase [Ruminiclostridium papyrosolvens DSM 2782]WES32717.1 HAMP domain-containing sensor histidine kinase [Ruminiclostridium papyrosolvens DSM 2782]